MIISIDVLKLRLPQSFKFSSYNVLIPIEFYDQQFHFLRYRICLTIFWIPLQSQHHDSFQIKFSRFTKMWTAYFTVFRRRYVSFRRHVSSAPILSRLQLAWSVLVVVGAISESKIIKYHMLLNILRNTHAD